MVVTTSIKLERMLLHSFATSTVKPGMVRKKPSCETGTPTTVNRSSAVNADHCCRNVMMRASINEGIGTIHKRKPSGKRKVRAARVPKHRTNAPAHQLTTASMERVSRVSGPSAGPHFDNAAITADSRQKASPHLAPGVAEGFSR